MGLRMVPFTISGAFLHWALNSCRPWERAPGAAGVAQGIPQAWPGCRWRRRLLVDPARPPFAKKPTSLRRQLRGVALGDTRPFDWP